MFNSIPKDILERYLQYHMASMPQKVKSMTFLMEFFNDEYHDKKVLLSAPLHIVMKVTSRCNMNCLHCSQKSKFRSAEETDMTDWAGIIDRLYEIGTIFLTITGGEPLLHPEIKGIISHAKRRGLLLSLLTNGTLLTSELIDFLSETLTKDDVVKISIDDVYDAYSNIRLKNQFTHITNCIDSLKQKAAAHT